MRIDARIGDVHAGQQARRQNGGCAGASFSDAMNKATANYSENVDFTNMTCQELRDWMSSQIRSGKMTLAGSLPIFMLTVRGGADVPEDTRYNFIQIAREGIQFALSHNDEKVVRLLEAGLRIMQKAMSETE